MRSSVKSALFILLILALYGSCKKDTYVNKGIASLNVINASINTPWLYVYFTFADSNYFEQQTPVYFGTNEVYSPLPGQSPLSLISSSDTIKPLFRTTIRVNPGDIYSLYISGIGRQVDTLYQKENIPLYSDSVAGLRFVNLSPGSEPMSVNLEGNPPGQPEFANLGYRQISDFKNYSTSGGITNHNFEIRDQLTGNLLSTYSWDFSSFKNYTLVIAGSADPSLSSPITVFAVRNF
jgi:hypothetical protein